MCLRTNFNTNFNNIIKRQTERQCKEKETVTTDHTEMTIDSVRVCRFIFFPSSPSSAADLNGARRHTHTHRHTSKWTAQTQRAPLFSLLFLTTPISQLYRLCCRLSLLTCNSSSTGTGAHSSENKCYCCCWWWSSDRRSAERRKEAATVCNNNKAIHLRLLLLLLHLHDFLTLRLLNIEANQLVQWLRWRESMCGRGKKKCAKVSAQLTLVL